MTSAFNGQQGRLGWWAVRFLAAAGASSVACSGNYSATLGSGGSGGSGVNTAGSGADSGSRVEAGGGGAEPEPAHAGAVSSDPSSDAGASGRSPREPTGDNRFPCLNAVPYGNAGSGLERCDNGMLRRASVGTCAVAAADGGCLEDADCPPINGFGTICVCDANGSGACRQADCSSDDDCLPGFSCVGEISYCAINPIGFACQTPSDACGSAADCGAGSLRCIWLSGSLVHTCADCGTGGRPFLIESLARTARSAPRSDWLEPSLQIAAAELSADVRCLLAAHWQQQAETEHASVAAFARFILELLSLAAPPDLLSAATNALADETAHARLCYALASSYAGRALGPAELDVTGALGELGLHDIVSRAVLEGCVGETLAAIEASEAASHALDESLRRALTRIAEDEARHAELSWRFVRWALSRGGSELRAVVRSAFRKANAELASRSAATRTAPDIELLSHGVLTSERRARLGLAVFETVIGPCVDALLLEPVLAELLPLETQAALHG